MTATAKLVAQTVLSDIPALEAAGYQLHSQFTTGNYESDADELGEFAGRLCYISFDRPNPDTATNRSYLGHILDIGHESVLEHSSATFLISASRSVLTELERHRHLSFSVVSQRYVDANKLSRHLPPALSEITDDTRYLEAVGAINQAENAAREAYDKVVEVLLAEGKPRKKAREAGRSVLPNLIDSPMLVTGNLRAWRYVIGARWHEAADAEIRQLMEQIIPQLREIAPNTFADIPFQPFSY